MRFRNYVNSRSGRNRIFSDDDIWNMRLSNLMDNEADILAQNYAIGIPTVQELEQSPNTRKVEDYSIYGDNAEAVARWEAALDDLAEVFDSSKNDPRSRPTVSDEEDSSNNGKNKNNKNNNSPTEQQEQSPVESNTETETSGEEKTEMPKEVSENVYQEPDLDDLRSGRTVLQGGVQENVKATEEIPVSHEREQVDEYENLFPLVYQKTDLPDYNKQDVDSKSGLGQKIEDSLASIAEKYEGLDAATAGQKAASKLALPVSELEYYGIASKLADNEEQNPEVLKNNDFYKLDDIKDETLKKIYYDKAAKMYNLDPNAKDTYEKLKNVDVVVPKETSKLNSQIKDSEVMQRWIAENYEKIKNGNISQSSTVFSSPSDLVKEHDKRALFGTLNKVDLHNPKINKDGSMSVILNDAYDFSIMEHKKYEPVKTNSLKDDILKNSGNRVKILGYNQIVDANNRAQKQQEAGKIKNYILSTSVSYTPEELEEILRKYKRQ